jgi:hypothetical protein
MRKCRAIVHPVSGRRASFAVQVLQRTHEFVGQLHTCDELLQEPLQT